MDLFKQGNKRRFITTGNVRRAPNRRFDIKFKNQKNLADPDVLYYTRRNKPCISRCKQQISHYHNLKTALAPFDKFIDNNYPYPIGPAYEEIAEGFVVNVKEYPPGKFWCEVAKGDGNDEHWEEHVTHNNGPVYWDYCSLDKQRTISGFVRINHMSTDL
jgi:hypothetical protein